MKQMLSVKLKLTKLMRNSEQRKMGLTKKHFKGLDKAPTFVSPTLTYQQGYDYSFRKDKQVSLLTLSGRIYVPYTGYNQHLTYIEQGAEIGAAKLWYDKPRKQFYLLVSIQIEQPDSHPQDHHQVVGVDMGIRYLAVTSDTQENSSFYSGRRTSHLANHCARVRKRLQRKGTRHAKRRLVTISLAKTGSGRVTCQFAPMGRITKPKRHACKGMLSCGGVQTQACRLLAIKSLTSIPFHSLLSYKNIRTMM